MTTQYKSRAAPTPMQIEEWREEALTQYFDDDNIHVEDIPEEHYVAGYVLARTEQTTEIAELKEYKQWYDEAMIATNVAGYAGMSAAQVIEAMHTEIAQLKAQLAEHGTAKECEEVVTMLKGLLAQPEQDLTIGTWYAGEDIDRMVRELDVALYGENAARQAKLCDIVQPIIKRLTAQPEVEPVAYADGAFGGRFTYKCLNPAMVLPDNTAFYTHPAPFAQPEDDGSDWFYKLKFICRVLEGVSPDKTDMQTALGMARSLRRERWTAEKALQPLTADDVTDAT